MTADAIAANASTPVNATNTSSKRYREYRGLPP